MGEIMKAALRQTRLRLIKLEKEEKVSHDCATCEIRRRLDHVQLCLRAAMIAATPTGTEDKGKR